MLVSQRELPTHLVPRQGLRPRVARLVEVQQYVRSEDACVHLRLDHQGAVIRSASGRALCRTWITVERAGGAGAPCTQYFPAKQDLHQVALISNLFRDPPKVRNPTFWRVFFKIGGSFASVRYLALRYLGRYFFGQCEISWKSRLPKHQDCLTCFEIIQCGLDCCNG